MPALHQCLKAATASSHTALEGTALMRAFSGEDAPPSVYCAYLSRQWALHSALEPALRDWVGTALASQRLHKTAWLQHDLAALGIAPVPADTMPPVPRCRAASIGTMYVLEGATLGMRQLVRALPDGHPGRGDAGRFLAGYGEHTGARWREFLALLDSVDGAEWPQVIAGAESTFGAFHALFSEWRHAEP